MTKSYGEKVPFRLFQMPCCGMLLCWVNPRLPTYCPECGKRCLLELRSGEYTRVQSDAWLKVEDATTPVARDGIEAQRGLNDVFPGDPIE